MNFLCFSHGLSLQLLREGVQVEEESGAPRARGMREKTVSLPPLSTRDEPQGQPDTSFAREARPRLPRQNEGRSSTEFPQGGQLSGQRDGRRDHTTPEETREKSTVSILTQTG